MFDEDELETLQEGIEDEPDHIKKEKIKSSKISRTRLYWSGMGSVVLFIFIIFLISSSIISGALIGLSSVGGFGAEIEQLNGSGVAIYPAVGPTAACKSEGSLGFNSGGPGTEGESGVKTLPQLRAEIRNASVPPGNNLTFVKDIRVPEILPFEVFRTKITRSSIDGRIALGNASLYVTGLNASKLTIQNAQIREFFTDGSSANPRFFEGGTGTPVLRNPDGTKPGEFVIRNRPGETVEARIQGATARAHFIAFSELSLPDISLQTEYGNESDFNDPFGNISAGDNCPY
jgi:hypothetical protein